MKRILFVLPFVILFSCNNSKQKATKLSDFISNDASVVLKIDNIETFKTDWNANDLVSKISSTDIHNRITTQLDHFKYINTSNPVILGFEKTDDSLHYTLATHLTDSLFSSKSLDSLSLYHKVVDSILVLSNSKKTLDNLKPLPNDRLENLLKTSQDKSSFSLILNQDLSTRFGYAFIHDNLQSFSNASIFDTQITPDHVLINGISTSNDTLPKLINVFNNQVPQENSLQHIVPGNAEGYLSFTFNDFQLLYDNFKHYQQHESDSIFNPELFQTANEFGRVYYDNKNLLILKSIDVSATKEALRDHQTISSTYRNVSIFDFSDQSYFNTVFSPLISCDGITKYMIVDDYFVFSNSEEALQNCIASFQNGTTISSRSAFKDAMLHLSDETSLVSVSNSEKLKQQLQQLFQTESNLNTLNDYKISIIQLINDDNFTHIHGSIQKHKTRAQGNIISEEFNVTLDADIIMDPYFVTNHRTQGQDIVVQDVNNVLYLISNSGKLLWKKQLNGNILGRIQQVDIYKNGRLQLAFATPKRVYILDRNGNDVSPFPLKFNDQITQPLSVFDYDNRRNYRFLVSQGNTLIMYDKQGKRVNGFKHTSSGAIKTQPKHFRIGSKDYIVLASGNKMHILDRRGKIRVDVKDNISFSGNPIYLYKNHFTTTNTNGELIQVNQKGNVSTQNIGLDRTHAIDATSKTLIAMSDNNLHIKTRTVELDFGNYTQPKVFYINDKIYVSITDLQAQKVFMFDSQSEAISKFPVYGNSTIDFNNIDADRYLEFVTKGESNSIVVYEKN